MILLRLILIGIPMIPVLGAGLLFVGFDGWVLYKRFNVQKAVKALA